MTRARVMGFLTSVGYFVSCHDSKMAGSAMSNCGKGPTRNSTAGSATAKVIDQGSIALDCAVNGQIAAVASVCYFLVFENFNGNLDSLDGGTPSFECFHA